jgi:hypothetical protein
VGKGREGLHTSAGLSAYVYIIYLYLKWKHHFAPMSRLVVEMDCGRTQMKSSPGRMGTKVLYDKTRAKVQGRHTSLGGKSGTMVSRMLRAVARNGKSTHWETHTHTGTTRKEGEVGQWECTVKTRHRPQVRECSGQM